jgi:glycine hydroxymethyltransferase
MSTYKSLGGRRRLILSTTPVAGGSKPSLSRPDREFRRREIGGTRDDAARLAGIQAAYAARMAENADALARALDREGVAVFAGQRGFTQSHQFALEAAPLGGGQNAARRLRLANILACGIGLPLAPVDGDLNGLRLGTPEITRRGMAPGDMPELAGLVRRGLVDSDPGAVAHDTSAFRCRFQGLHFVRQ